MTIKNVQDINFHQQSKKMIADILKANKSFEISGDQIFIKFIQYFYHLLPLESLDITDTGELFKIAEEAYSFFLNRDVSKPKIRLFNPSKKKHGWNSKYSVLEIINTDSPFLLDSIKEELIRNQIKIHEILHPIIKVKRDQKGNVKDIITASNDGDYITESVMHIHITSVKEEESILKILNSIENILNNVKYAVQDWEKMINEAKLCIGDLIKNDDATTFEAKEFIEWLINNNFTFVGFIECNFNNTKNHSSDNRTLGIISLESSRINKKIITEVGRFTRNVKNKEANHNIIDIGRIDEISPIHRHSNLDFVAINNFNDKGKIISTKVFIGLFTSVLSYQSVEKIPIIRKKIDKVMEKSGFSSKSYSAKELMTILESLPREELLQIKEEDLYNIVINIYSLLIKPKIKLFLRRDNFNSYLSCLVFLPRDRFSAEISEKIYEILHNDLGGAIASQNIQLSTLPVAFLYTVLNTEAKDITSDDILKIENKLKELVKFWSEDLKEVLQTSYGEGDGEKIYRKYKDAFPDSYKEKFSANSALRDINLIDEALNSEQIIFDLYKAENNQDADNSLGLKIYTSKHKILLSEIMPILNNMGFSAIDESTFYLQFPKEQKNIWVHNFQLNISGYDTQTITELKEYEALENSEIKKFAEEALQKIWHNNMQNDALNKLIIRAGLTWRNAVLIRGLGKYIRQTGFIYGNDYVDDVLTHHPKLVSLMVQLFYLRFDPSKQVSDKDKKINQLNKQIEEKLKKVLSSAEDKVIRRFFDIIKSILRTNYFQKDDKGQLKDYISFKFDSSKVPELPLPRPYREIFVYSPRVEGIHLRGGKVARGGLRWSDRSEDFRTEVLGLMKAQMTKNTVIVPVGSKGGFVVKQSMALLGREDYLKEGIECYKIFLCGLLDVTDNIIAGKTVHPTDVVRYDDEDSYLVVAADKGTATFSDIANNISKQYNFWLGDAFASGGSAGYDHKKMGITARGGWISVKRHFTEVGVDIQTTDFTVIGIGDMAGDVFGNGMLLSKHIRLVGAFNHMHIFIDPNPDSAKSFIERKRLFEMPGSNWADYNKDLISKGGGVFDRKSKEIELTAEIRQLFEIEEKTLAPDELIKKILKAKVDLFWNGGIGTYVKASDENHQQVGDKANDNVRINGNELRCLAVGEGGNLGFTQRGRIEYALNGGRMNTDAIDNSAGVDCSDHEVNIKIALTQAIDMQQLNPNDRNKLLENMTDEVAELVLRDNQLQTQAITVAESQGFSILEMNSRLINKLESMKVLNREIEFLPSNQEFSKRSLIKKGLTRPEIAVLLAYSKLTIYNDLIKTNLPDDPYFYNDLLLYFPEKMRDKYAEAIAKHTLRQEIIITAITNSMVNRIGTFFYHFAQEDTGMPGSDIARAYTITRDAFDLRTLWKDIEALDGKIKVSDQVELFLQTNKLLQRCIFWFLRNSAQTLDINENVSLFKPMIKELVINIEKAIIGKSKERYDDKLSFFTQMQIPASLAKKISTIAVLSSACDIITVASKNNLPILQVAKLYFELGNRFHFDWLRSCVDKISIDSYWEKLSLKSLKDDLYDQQRKLTAEIIKYIKHASDPISQWSKDNHKQIERYDSFIKDLLRMESIDSSMLVVAAKRAGSLII
jgi:glutamate dehydrogenase